MSHEDVAQAIDIFLEILSGLGLPFAGPARLAVKGVESIRRSQEARRRLEERFQKAGEVFRQEAVEQGISENIIRQVQSLSPSLYPIRQALEALVKNWDEQELTERLRWEIVAVGGVSEEERARALALYLSCLRACLVGDEKLGPVVTALSTLRTEQKVERVQEAVDSLLKAVNALLGLPEDILAWPVQLPPEQVPELRAYLLHPKYRLVPYSGRPFEAMRDDLLAWARRLEEASPPVGLRTCIGPGGAGKTRLLIEAGEALWQEGWWVGFLRAGRLTKQNAPILCMDARPTLLIVDYIADRSEEVRTLLREAARAARERTAPLAIFLLERTFPHWLEADLCTYTDPDYVNWPEFLALPTVEKAPLQLPTLEISDRPALFEAALKRFCGLLPQTDWRPAPRYGEEELPKTPFYYQLCLFRALWYNFSKSWSEVIGNEGGNPGCRLAGRRRDPLSTVSE